MNREIYLDVAEEVFPLYFPDGNRNEFYKLIDSGDIVEIDDRIHLARVLRVVAQKAADILKREGFKIPADFVNILIFDNDFTWKARRLLRKIKRRCNKHFITKDFVAAFAVELIEALHEYWIQLNTKKFFNQDFKDLRFLFTPIYVLGVKIAMPYLVYVMPFVRVIFFDITVNDIDEVFKEKRYEYLTELHGVNDFTTFCDAIQSDWGLDRKDISMYFHKPAVAKDIAHQILQYTSEIF